MKEFLNSVIELINDMLDESKTEYLKEEEKVKKIYDSMCENEKKNSIQTLYEMASDDENVFFQLFPELFSITKDVAIENLILEYMCKNEIDVKDNMVYLGQINTIDFLANIVNEEVKELKKEVWNKIQKQLREIFNENMKWIPIEKRVKNRILFMIEPMLGERHAPTKILYNLYYFYEQMGYEVMVLSTSIRKFTKYGGLALENKYIMRSLYEENGKYELNYAGVNLKGINIEISNFEFESDINNIIEFVKQYKPEYIVSIGGSYAADICSGIVDVATIATTSNMPLCKGKYIINTFDRDYEKDDKEKRVIKWKIVLKKFPTEEKLSKKDLRGKYGIEQGKFCISVVGNRLDEEVTDEFISIMENILKLEKKVVFVIVGNCEELQSKLQIVSENYDHYVFTGETDDFIEMMKIADLQLNPKRRGAAGGPMHGLKWGVPVITMPDCDVAYGVGEEFICRDYSEYIPLVKRYIEDLEFRENKVKKALEKYKENEDASIVYEEIEALTKEIRN